MLVAPSVVSCIWRRSECVNSLTHIRLKLKRECISDGAWVDGRMAFNRQPKVSAVTAGLSSAPTWLGSDWRLLWDGGQIGWGWLTPALASDAEAGDGPDVAQFCCGESQEIVIRQQSHYYTILKFIFLFYYFYRWNLAALLVQARPKPQCSNV